MRHYKSEWRNARVPLEASSKLQILAEDLGQRQASRQQASDGGQIKTCGRSRHRADFRYINELDEVIHSPWRNVQSDECG